MTIAYLNGEFMPLEEARISPMDRGFLFGDGIYEVIPSYDGRMVGFGPHISRMRDGLGAIEINLGWDDEQPRHIVSIRHPFWIGRAPVTNDQFGRLL